MLYLSGVVRRELVADQVGFIITPDMSNRVPEGATWAADTGCYAQGDTFDLERYLRWLAVRDPARCLFATAPDVVGDAAATWIRSRDVLPRIRQLGFPNALVAQDGLTAPPWNDFDALFIGGTTRWKEADTGLLCREAKKQGKWLHMGRVNSFRRLRLAAMLGCDSVDGTFLQRAPDLNAPRMQRWLRDLNANPVMVMV